MVDSDRTYIIAEMACSHEGKPDLAQKIISGTNEAGANAIQFQVWARDDMVTPQQPDYDTLARIELSRQDWAGLAKYVRETNSQMQIIACVYERGSVDFCESINVDAYKLHSADLSNPYLVKYVAATGKRIDLSVGASTLGEIETALEWIRETSDSQIWMMYGYQNFPTPTDAINLNYMMKLREMFELPLGYQDHSDGNSEAAFSLPAAALGMGVDILEKHVTHDRSFKGIDHEAALNPDEFIRFVAMVREIEAAKGSSRPRPFSVEEIKYRKYAKKSMVTAHDLPEGKVIEEEDLLFMRAEALGLPPDQARRLVGRKTNREIQAFNLIKEEDVE
ncbi:N-acetylneuraminate synthase family protein [Candidatus Hydrogenedentota bacterium]